ncbi:MAG: putative S-layer protein [Candidatus Pacearchaeota archaeon]
MGVTQKLQHKMKQYLLTAVLCTLFLASIVSAITLSISTQPAVLTRDDNVTTFRITSNENVTFSSPSSLIIEDNDGNQALLSIINTTALSETTSATYRATLTSINSDFNLGKYTENVNINAMNITDSTVISSISVPLSFEQDYCEVGNVGDLDIDVDIQNVEGYGEKDLEWYMFDKIEVEVTVENNGNDDLGDVIVEWGVYNKRTGEFVIEEEEDAGDIDEDEEGEVKIAFTLDPNDFDADDNEDDFVFFVKAYSDESEEANQCISASEDVTIMKDKHFVIVGNIKVPETAQCGDTVEVTAEVWNIGDNDEENVYVTVENKELKIDEKIEVGDLDVFDDKKISFEFVVPSGISEKLYGLDFKVYDEDDDVYQNDEDEESTANKILKVSGNCQASQQKVSISAVLDSEEAVAGKEFSVKATLTNLGSEKTSYQVLATGYESWANIVSTIPSILELEPGQSKDVIIKLVPNKDASGDNEFKIQAVSGDKITEQRVSVVIKKSGGFFSGLTGFTISDNLGGNWFIWAIAILNVILIVIIIIVAIKIASK